MSEKNPETAVEAIAMSVRGGSKRVEWKTDDTLQARGQFQDLVLHGRLDSLDLTVDLGTTFEARGVLMGLPFEVGVSWKSRPLQLHEKLAEAEQKLGQAEADRLRLFEVVADIIRTLPGCGVTAPDASEWYRDIRERVLATQAAELPF